ncbi:LolA family protein [Limobrevibacterium gyesilva]|uniref:Outer membrane lipoprotein carrier protein LolA n=1 Tax=Limobrevibacterium gyesilva TaxID=2991712 RepID=A0AA41YVL8_9PROT|nr:outer membrane lipoprotein carrier protein LolA [Limobrevibacterium gyesilva]MCW3477250.1 outer membrane lipoprotein carrier protein LolA [Limobrevibacterium gyesilva]
MNRRTLFALPLLSLAASALPGSGSARAQAVALTPQDRADIARIETYLDGLHSLKGRFLQVSPNGATSEGTAWVERPGRLRFEYDPPSPLLLIAGHGLVVFHDKKLQQTSNFPLSSTPLGILLADNVRLTGNVTVTGIFRLPGQLQVTMVRTSSPGDGSLTLIFADNPLSLRQWAVIDGQRQETRVSLFNVQLGDRFDQKLFEFEDPRMQPGYYTPGR